MSTRIPLHDLPEALEPLLPWIGSWLDGSESQAPESPVEILKHSALRLVLRVPDPGQGSHILKLYRRKGGLEALRSLWLRSRALRERRILEEAAQRQIPCPGVIDAGHSAGRMPELGWLLLEDLGGGESLDAIHRGRGLTVEELTACAELLKTCLDEGLHHRDLHLGNLYRKDTGELFLLDLHSADFRERTSRRHPRDFRPLYLSFPWPWQRSARRALLNPLGLPADPPELPSWRQHWLRRRLRRCLRDSGAFYWRDGVGQTRSTSFSRDELLQALDSSQERKTGRRGQVRRSPLGIHKTRKAARTRQLWLAAEALALREIPHPAAIAIWPLPDGKACILAQELEGAREIDSVDASDMPALAADLGRSFGRLHGTGWRFRDARGDNFLVLHGRVHFVDLDGCSPLPVLRSESACAADLGRLLAWLRHQAPPQLQSRAGELGRLFLRQYVRERRALDGEPRALHSLCTKIALRSQAWRASHK